jgi:hypothetical protein
VWRYTDTHTHVHAHTPAATRGRARPGARSTWKKTTSVLNSCRARRGASWCSWSMPAVSVHATRVCVCTYVCTYACMHVCMYKHCMCIRLLCSHLPTTIYLLRLMHVRTCMRRVHGAEPHERGQRHYLVPSPHTPTHLPIYTHTYQHTHAHTHTRRVHGAEPHERGQGCGAVTPPRGLQVARQDLPRELPGRQGAGVILCCIHLCRYIKLISIIQYMLYAYISSCVNEAYKSRDKICLVSFQGDRAQVSRRVCWCVHDCTSYCSRLCVFVP